MSARSARAGILFHHYQVDEDGKLARVNLIIATGQNALAMNRAPSSRSPTCITSEGPEIPEGILNPAGGGHPVVRPVPELLDSCGVRHDAFACAVD